MDAGIELRTATSDIGEPSTDTAGDTPRPVTKNESLLSKEVGLQPDERFVALANQLRARSVVRNEADVAMPRSGATRDAADPPHSAGPDVPPRHRIVARRAPIALAALAVVTFIVTLATWSSKRAGAIENRIVVMPFENRTHDASLDDIGYLLADWLTDGLVKGGNPVVAATSVHQLIAREPAAIEPMALARRTHATSVVAGWYTRSGDSLAYRAEVLNVADGSVLASVGPLRGLLTETAAFDSLLDRIAVVHELVNKGRMHALRSWSQPRSMAALRLFNTAMNEHFAHRDWLGAIPLFARAHALDSM
jgi:TolB-like protein